MLFHLGFLFILIVTQVHCKKNWAVEDLQRCPIRVPRWRFVWGAPALDKCYEFRLEKRTWQGAYHACYSRGGRLVTIKTRDVQRFLVESMASMQYGPSRVWIGASDKVREMKWEWITGERVNAGYQNWARGQPSCGIFLCIEDCAVMHWRESGQWHDYHCNLLDDLPYICEYDMGPEVPSTTTTTTTTTIPPTTTTTRPTTTTTPAPTTATVTSTISLATKSLESAYLFHNGNEREDNRTVAVLVPPQIASGSGLAGVASVQEQDSTHKAGLNIAILLVGIFIGLAAGLCLFLLLARRRRQASKPKEEDPALCFNNPNYDDIPGRQEVDDTQLPDSAHLLQPVTTTAAAGDVYGDADSDEEWDISLKGAAGFTSLGAVCAVSKSKFTDNCLGDANTSVGGSRGGASSFSGVSSRRENDYSAPAFLFGPSAAGASDAASAMSAEDDEAEKLYANCEENIYESLENIRAQVAELERQENLSQAKRD